jgi:hypothetical protein
MPTIYIECPSCGFEGKIDDALVGKKMKCRQCQQPFVAEIGGTYDLERPPVPEQPEFPVAAPEAPSNGKRGKKSKAKPPAQQPSAQLNAFLEKWPEE